MRRKIGGTEWRGQGIAIGATAIAGLVVVGVVVASSGAFQAEVKACIEPATGHLFIAPGGRPCPGASLTWNQQGPAGPQGPPGPAGAQGPPGTPGATSSVAAYKLVSKTIVGKKAKNTNYAGTWWFSSTPTVTLKCPTGWTALTSGYSVRSLFYTSGVADASTTVDQPIVTAEGRPIGFKLRLEVEPRFAPSKTAFLTKHPWVAALYVVCTTGA